jgi:phage replication O-like protein O
MASPQLENGYTKIANEIIEVLNCCKLTDYERIVIYTVVRKTYGWGKSMDWISHGQISKSTGVLRTKIVSTTSSLIKRKILFKEGKKIGLQKDWEQWEVKWRLVPSQVLPSTPEGTSTSTPEGTHKRKKETIQQGDQSPLLKDNPKSMSGWNKKGDDFIEADMQIDPDFVPKGQKKKPKKVSDDVQAVFELFNNPASALWRMREIERVAAQALFDCYGLETLTKRMTRIEKEKKNKDPYFPEVNTPSQLLDKMPNVERYLNI